MRYAEVLLPLNLAKSLTYKLPRETDDDLFGCRVAVELRGALYTGVITGLSQAEPEGYQPKEIVEILRTESEVAEAELSDAEFLLFEALENNPSLSIEDVSAILQRKNALPVVRKMIAQGWLRVFREYAQRYTPKKESVVRLSDRCQESPEALREAFDATERSERQRLVLMALLDQRAKG